MKSATVHQFADESAAATTVTTTTAATTIQGGHVSLYEL